MRYVFGFLVLLAGTGAGVLQASRDDRLRPRCRPSTKCMEKESSAKTSYRYEVNDQELIVEFQDGEYFKLFCNSNSKDTLLSADDSAMPTMTQNVTVEQAVFNHCVIPNSTYYDALKALNISVSKILIVHLPGDPNMKISHLKGLEITELEIVADNSINPPRASSDFLDEIQGLRSLKLTDIVLEPKALSRLPTSLETLNIVNARLPAAERELSKTNNMTTHWIERLVSLRSLHLVESSKFVTENPGVELTLPRLAKLPNITNASLYHMQLDKNGLSTWLKGSSLKQLILKSCGLTTLSRSMFQDVNLTKINLSNNELKSLEDGLFTPLRNSLIELNLSNNKLTALQSAVEHLKRLETLKANNNPLGSLCGDDVSFIKSRLESLLPSSLRWLELSGTEATRICSDWIRNSMYNLMYIDLSNNNITELEYSDLEMERITHGTSNEVTIDLTRNKLRKIEVSREDYSMCIKQASPTTPNEAVVKRVPVKLILKSIPCGCDAYWLREVLRDCPLLRINNDVACTPVPKGAYEKLLEYGRDEIPCPYSGFCTPGCLCEKRLRDNATIVRCGTMPSAPPPLQWPPAGPGYPLSLHVANGTLDHVPNITLVELYAPNNNISTLEDIPKTLKVLDVSSNYISHISSATARVFKENNSKVNLSGNPLACDCTDVPAFGLLKYVVLDWNSTQCTDQTPVSEKTERELCSSLVLPILFGVAVPLLLLIVTVLVILHMLPRIKQFLFRHDLFVHLIDSANDDIDDPNKTHDVFLSYSHADLEQLLQLKTGLEKLGYSTIEHQSDWGPGEHIFNQITNSVQKARRTLLLVSDNYASSQWAEQEFHYAHAHAMDCRTARVLIVRCGLNNPKALPKDLQHYLYNNTYLDWEDKKFWIKLWRVMPPLRQKTLHGPLDLNPPSPLSKPDSEKMLLQILIEPNSPDT